MLNENWNSKFKINGAQHKITDELDKGYIYGYHDRRMKSSINYNIKGGETYLHPVFYSEDPDACVPAYFLSNKLPAVTIKEIDGFTSIFYGSKAVKWDFLKSVARFAGCHIYSETGDCIYANKNFITIHASFTGRKKLAFPHVCNPLELYEEVYYGKGVAEIEFDMLKGETKMFQIRMPENHN